jgi:hypothetical protein
MSVDEIRALEAAVSAVDDDKASPAAEYWLNLEDGYWEVGSTDRVAWVRADSGDLVSNFLSPVSALAAAKFYAHTNSLGWKPTFTLRLKPDHWIVGSCQSQFGGQTYIYVSHDGSVTRHSVNPK